MLLKSTIERSLMYEAVNTLKFKCLHNFEVIVFRAQARNQQNVYTVSIEMCSEPYTDAWYKSRTFGAEFHPVFRPTPWYA